MLLAVTILAWLLVAVLAVLVLFLITPVRLLVRLKSGPVARFELVARPFGGVCPPLRVSSGEGGNAEEKVTRKKPAKKKKPGKKKTWRGAAGRGPDILKAVPRLVSRLLHQIRIDSLTLDGEFGLGDPAETGQLYGVLAPLLFGTSGFPRTSIDVRPNFNERCLSGALETNISLTPAALIPPVVRFIWIMFGPRR